MDTAASYAFCEQVARKQAKNFYLTFLLLSAPQRKAMCAIYAFMRYCDDLSDGDVVDGQRVTDRRAAIGKWSADLEQVLAGRLPEHPVWPAFADAIQQYDIPHQYFRDMIAGVSSDLEPRTVQTFDELYRYCYQVASVVGLTIVHVFGFADLAQKPEALKLAEKCGIAFQLTNILRDVREDAGNQRIYLPSEDLVRFGVAGEDLLQTTMPAGLRNLMEFEAQRAQAYYAESAPMIQMVHPQSRGCLRALIGIYSRLLDKIEASGYDVLSQRVRVPTAEKLWILARSRFA
ncbi:MAG: phytoene/squalene synthase family protein [Acidobacteriota bacterium]